MKKIIVCTLLGVVLAISPALVGASLSLGDLTLTAVKARIFTPNGDGINDKARFEFDNPQMLPVSGTVYDISGARVADLQAPTGGDSSIALVWDGKDDGGTVVAGGIYIYQITYLGKQASGTVIVAR